VSLEDFPFCSHPRAGLTTGGIRDRQASLLTSASVMCRAVSSQALYVSERWLLTTGSETKSGMPRSRKRFPMTVLVLSYLISN
jgi:hypothetical protein